MTFEIDRRTLLGAVAGFAPGTAALSQTVAAPPEAAILRAAPRPTTLAPALPKPADTWLFDGALRGPVLRVRHGDELRATLRNDTALPLSLHPYGVRGPAVQDGVGGLSQPPVPPGGSFEIRFTPPDAGTFLLRPAVLGGAAEPAGRGLGGLLVVEERDASAFDADLPLLVRDWWLTADGALQPFGAPEVAAGAGRLGNLVTVDGEPAPRRLAYPPGSRLRLRLANGCNARILRIRFEGAKAFVAAVDGQPTETFEPLRATLPFGPGSRYDIVLDVPGEPGAKAAIVALVGPGLPLVEITAGEGRALERPPLAALPPNRTLPPEIKLQNAVRATATLAGGAPRPGAGGPPPPFNGDPRAIWTVNGAPGAVSRPPLFTARRGQPVVVAINNTTGFAQPMHLHGHVFRLLHSMDDGWEPYWLDTLQVPEGRTLHIAFLAENPGRWLLASPVLERQDTGLWTWFEVKG